MSFRPRVPYFTVLQRLNLTTNLQLCLDAGDSASYDPAVQTDKWLDRSGNGYDFYRGSGTGADAGDPTFNGTAGALSTAEYWSSDGGDYFTYDSANETWMENIHKDNAAVSFLLWYYQAGTGSGGVLGDLGAAAGNTGFRFTLNATNVLQFAVFNIGTSVASLTTTGTVTADAWNCIGLILDEASGGTATKIYINGAVESFDGTYTLPSSSGASFALAIGTRGSSNTPMRSGARVAMVAGWNAVKTTADFDKIYNATHSNFLVQRPLRFFNRRF